MQPSWRANVKLSRIMMTDLEDIFLKVILILYSGITFKQLRYWNHSLQIICRRKTYLSNIDMLNWLPQALALKMWASLINTWVNFVVFCFLLFILHPMEIQHWSYKNSFDFVDRWKQAVVKLNKNVKLRFEIFMHDKNLTNNKNIVYQSSILIRDYDDEILWLLLYF